MTARTGVAPRALNLRTPPVHLENVARWSDDPERLNPRELIIKLKGMPQLLSSLEAAARSAAAHTRGHLPRSLNPRRHGPRRMPGSWVLAYIGFAASDYCDIQPWHTEHLSDTDFWLKLCGFTRIPRYQTVYQCFTELERTDRMWNAAAAQLIQRVRQQDPRVGAWWHVDATEAETNGTPVHDCMPNEPCPTRGHSRVVRVNTLVASELRRKTTDALVKVEEQGDDAAEVTVSWQGTTTSRIASSQIDHERRGVRVFANGHYWFSRDFDAGTRAYYAGRRLTKFWHGYMAQTATDHFTGLPLAIRLFPASRSEAAEYPALFERASRNVGSHKPLLVAGDRGYSFASVYEHNTRRGVGSVFQYRRVGAPHQPPQATATDLFDEHGVPRCQHCGGFTDFVRFRIDGKKANRPRLWVKCAYPITDACDREQAVSCSKDWRRLLPVWRTHPAYAAMSQSHRSFERIHQQLRSNYLVAPNAFTIRPKRIGMRWQQLRANVALFLEWLRFNLQGPIRLHDVVDSNGRNVSYHIARRRARLGLVGGGIIPLRRPPRHPPPLLTT